MNLALFAAAFGMGIAAFGASMGIAILGGKATESIARQPEAASQIRGAMNLGVILCEATAIYTLAVAILIWIKVG